MEALEKYEGDIVVEIPDIDAKREHLQVYHKEENPNATFYVEEQVTVDLFPYKIKERDRFLQRNHPKGLHPDSMTYETYWTDFITKCIEGLWVEDKNGVHVFMFPKLFYYINYVTILDAERDKINPDLCDLEWIFFTYFMCIDGFSGFEGDEKYTCNRLVERYEKSMDERLTKQERRMHELNFVELKSIPESCFLNGTQKMKQFVDPWTYLTRTYLIDDPRGPLGLPLYENQRRNGFILGARGIRKSFTVYMGDFLHEWTFSGVRRMADLHKVNNPLLFAMGSGSKVQLQRTVNNIVGFYDDQPGKYQYDDPDKADYMGPLYKNYQGKLTVGKTFQHVIKGRNNIVELFGSTVQLSVITPDRTKIVAGDRFRRVYIEEVGFLEYIEEVFDANIDSLKLGGTHVGSWIATGTGGDMEAIKGSKKMAENPESYDIFGIPYYWKNASKKFCLFIPAQYQQRKLEDGQGFVYLDLATEFILKERQKWAEALDSVAAAARVMYNPIVPDEMLIPNELSILPKREAQIRLNEIESFDIFKKFANVGELHYDASYPHGVRFEKDMKHKLHPVKEYNVDFHKVDSSGAFCMYEPPPNGKVPENMYWVIYDPAAKSGEGTSMHSVIVYKHFASKDSSKYNFRDAVVAEWIGRLGTLPENYERVIKIAKYYNARIFPEINVAGFVEWCRTNKYTHLLQRDSYQLQKEVTPGAKRSYYKAGFQMNQRMKWWALQRYSDWLLEVRTWDSKSGIPTTRGIDYVYSPRILNEVVYYNEVDNFDHTSSMLGLMILLSQLENYKPDEEDEIKDDGWIEPIIHKPTVAKRRRSRLENF